MENYQYVGAELDLFREAVNWKRHWGRRVLPFVRGRVLDVGAGQGNNLPILLNDQVREWTALEPDAALLATMAKQGPVAADPRVCPLAGDSAGLLARGAAESFDCLLYIDVMEHIDDHRAEMERAAALTRPGGTIIVLSPAFPALFSEFDRSVGHFRRYTRASIRDLDRPDLVTRDVRYLDSVGCALSLVNRLFLRQSLPTLAQIRFWDRCIIPISRVFDPLLHGLLGRSVLAVWEKRARG